MTENAIPGSGSTTIAGFARYFWRITRPPCLTGAPCGGDAISATGASMIIAHNTEPVDLVAG
eukprot:CAMPEP_0180805480 /NCGR_PEP_ID=MMETSP1038_2-20121128/62044_1 /TAXON_ID=632150 /ORGANISM="Azadinium spinosum, Strain 3D9" /LENGTH=61 /DNA_ID=CAMNT_0022846047 /DNA_START=40 /DNA_END=222 /DNA_ORIENTATION=+